MATPFSETNARFGRYLDVLSNLDELREYPLHDVSEGDALILVSKAIIGDGDGAIYFWDSRSTAVDDGAKTIRPNGGVQGRWIRAFGKGEFTYSDTDFAAALVRLNAGRTTLAQSWNLEQTFLNGIKSNSLKSNGATLALGEAGKAVTITGDTLGITVPNTAVTGSLAVSGAFSAVGAASFSAASFTGAVTLPSTVTINGLNIDDKYQTKAKYSSMITTALTAYTLPVLPAEIIETTSSSAVTITIPTDASANIAIGSRVDIAQIGSGQITIVAASGVTLRSDSNKTKVKGQYAGATVYKRAANDWVLFGALA